MALQNAALQGGEHEPNDMLERLMQKMEQHLDTLDKRKELEQRQKLALKENNRLLQQHIFRGRGPPSCLFATMSTQTEVPQEPEKPKVTPAPPPRASFLNCLPRPSSRPRKEPKPAPAPTPPAPAPPAPAPAEVKPSEPPPLPAPPLPPPTAAIPLTDIKHWQWQVNRQADALEDRLRHLEADQERKKQALREAQEKLEVAHNRIKELEAGGVRLAPQFDVEAAVDQRVQDLKREHTRELQTLKRELHEALEETKALRHMAAPSAPRASVDSELLASTQRRVQELESQHAAQGSKHAAEVQGLQQQLQDLHGQALRHAEELKSRDAAQESRHAAEVHSLQQQLLDLREESQLARQAGASSAEALAVAQQHHQDLSAQCKAQEEQHASQVQLLQRQLQELMREEEAAPTSLAREAELEAAYKRIAELEGQLESASLQQADGSPARERGGSEVPALAKEVAAEAALKSAQHRISELEEQLASEKAESQRQVLNAREVSLPQADGSSEPRERAESEVTAALKAAEQRISELEGQLAAKKVELQRRVLKASEAVEREDVEPQASALAKEAAAEAALKAAQHRISELETQLAAEKAEPRQAPKKASRDAPLTSMDDSPVMQERAVPSSAPPRETAQALAAATRAGDVEAANAALHRAGDAAIGLFVPRGAGGQGPLHAAAAGSEDVGVALLDFLQSWQDRRRHLLSLQLEMLSRQARLACDSPDAEGKTPLLEIMQQASPSRVLAQRLVAAKANLAHRDVQGLTATLHCAQAGHRRLMEVLLGATHGAVASDADDTGRRPMHLAAKAGHNEVVSLLLQVQAEPDATDHEGATPLSLAGEAGHLAVVATLGGPLAFGEEHEETPFLGQEAFLHADGFADMPGFHHGFAEAWPEEANAAPAGDWSSEGPPQPSWPGSPEPPPAPGVWPAPNGNSEASGDAPGSPWNQTGVPLSPGGSPWQPTSGPPSPERSGPGGTSARQPGDVDTTVGSTINGSLGNVPVVDCTGPEARITD